MVFTLNSYSRVQWVYNDLLQQGKNSSQHTYDTNQVFHCSFPPQKKNNNGWSWGSCKGQIVEAKTCHSQAKHQRPKATSRTNAHEAFNTRFEPVRIQTKQRFNSLAMHSICLSWLVWKGSPLKVKSFDSLQIYYIITAALPIGKGQLKGIHTLSPYEVLDQNGSLTIQEPSQVKALVLELFFPKILELQIFYTNFI